MKIAILVAMQKELELFLPLLENVHTENSDIFVHYIGKIGHHDIAIAKCGIGKVNSALSAYNMINSYSPDLVINTGVAGGAGSGVAIGSLLVADYAAYHDVWCGPGTDLGCADGCSVFLPADRSIIDIAKKLLSPKTTIYGLICTGDRFISRHEEVEEIKRSFPSVKAVDMESASIAHVCALKKVPFNILRVVSDTPGEGKNIEQYQNFWKEAPQKTFEAVRTIIEAI